MRQDVTGFFTMLQGAQARGWMEIRARARGGGNSGPGAGWGGDSSPGAGWWEFEPGRGVGVGIRARARGGDFFGKMENFLPFCRFFAV